MTCFALWYDGRTSYVTSMVWTKNALFPQGHICIDAPCPDLVLSGESDEPEEESKGAPKQATGNLAEDSTRGDAEYGSDKTEK